MTEKPLFLPLKTEYYEAFCDGSKTVEYRRGEKWNSTTCRIGRRVTISKGYGKQSRRNGTIVNYWYRFISGEAWVKCYGAPGWGSCIEIKLDDQLNPG